MRPLFLLPFAAFWIACGGGAAKPGGACKTTRDCVAGESCIGGSCKQLDRKACATDSECGVDQTCSAGECVALEPDAGISNAPDASDDDAGQTPVDAGRRDLGIEGYCLEDLDCAGAPEEICLANQCVRGCGQENGLPCTGGLVCDMASGRCVSPTGQCATDSECGAPARICEGGQCIAGCVSNAALCQQGTEVCNTNTGRCVLLSGMCSNDQQCGPPQRVCEGGQCVPGCAQAGGVQCTGATPQCDQTTGRCTAGMTCTLDADCMDPNRICVNSTCTLRCNAPGAPACPAPTTCNAASGRCIQSNLALGADCTDNIQCLSGFCLDLTIGTMSRQICTEACGATSQCPRDFTCGDVGGMRFCLSESLTNPPTQFDTASGGSCTENNNNCQSGWCNTGASACIETCSRANDCTSFGGNCFTYQQTVSGATVFEHLCVVPQGGAAIGASCTQNSNCRTGICNRYNSVCGAHCCSDADCPSNQNCTVYDLDADEVVKICAPRANGLGNGALGVACTQNTDCETGVCLPESFDNPMSQRRCTTTCCRNTECSAIGGGVCRPVGGPVMNTIVGVCFRN